MDKIGAKYRIINTFLLLYSPGDFSSASLPYYLYFLRTFCFSIIINLLTSLCVPTRHSVLAKVNLSHKNLINWEWDLGNSWGKSLTIFSLKRKNKTEQNCHTQKIATLGLDQSTKKKKKLRNIYLKSPLNLIKAVVVCGFFIRGCFRLTPKNLIKAVVVCGFFIRGCFRLTPNTTATEVLLEWGGLGGLVGEGTDYFEQ